MTTKSRRNQSTVVHVRKGELIQAEEVNRWRDHVADMSLGFASSAAGINYQQHPGGTTVELLDTLGFGGVNVGSNGIRLRCLNIDPRTIPQYSVVELDVSEWSSTRWQGDEWPNNPRILVHRPRKAGLVARVGWVDHDISAETEGTVIVGGWGVVWFYVRKPNTYPIWSGSRVAYRPRLSGIYQYASTHKGSFRLYASPVGSQAVLACKHWAQASEPEWEWHPEINDTSDYYQRWMAVVQFRPWWG